MSCCGSSGDYNLSGNLCSQDISYPSISAESVPSLINNLVTSLYGTITKDASSGQIVWQIPCDPNQTAQITNVPRYSGEGLMCYVIRGLNYAINNAFPVTLTGVQTLLNKTLVSPTITGTGSIAGTFTGNLTGNVAGNVTGNVTGSVTGNVAGNLTGNVTGNVTGNLTGNVTGNVTGNLTGNVTGNVTGDGNSSFAGLITSGQLIVTSPSVSGASATITNTSTGGHSWLINSNGSANSGGAGALIFYDSTVPAVRLIIGTNGAVDFQGNPINNTSGIQGTTAVGNAAAGYVGEYLSATNATALALANSVWGNVTSLQLTPGDWDVWGVLTYNTSATTSITRLIASVFTQVAPNWWSQSDGSTQIFMPATVPGAQTPAFMVPIPAVRYNVSANTTLYLNAYGVFTGASQTLTAIGKIYARRMR